MSGVHIRRFRVQSDHYQRDTKVVMAAALKCSFGLKGNQESEYFRDAYFDYYSDP